jgi:DeoR/GlpR family transcriptional regulator of sugar metabolism
MADVVTETGRRDAADARPDDRRARLLELVEGQGYCTVVELAGLLGVSDMTVRRDVRRLVSEHRLRSVHGGVTLLPSSALRGTHIAARTNNRTVFKRAIAERAIEYVPRTGAFALDAGTTTLELARLLPDHDGLHVVTPSVAVINVLMDYSRLRITSPGGTLYPQAEAFAGPATSAALEELRVQTVFLAASGIGADGVYSGTDYDAVTKRSLVKIADSVVLLADSSKFSRSALVRACALGDVTRAVIDDGISAEQQRMFEDAGVIVDVVSATAPQPAAVP